MGGTWLAGRQVVRLLYDLGGDVGARNRDGDTPLHLAAWTDSLPAARALVTNRAQRTACGRDGVAARAARAGRD